MKDVILVYDDLNIGTEDIPGLDYFFYSCAQNFVFDISNGSCSISELCGNKISLPNVNELIDNKDSPFLFIAYSHGSDDSLLYNNQNDFYVKSGENDSKFDGCIFYTWSCLTGKILGQSLLSNNCIAYVGYDDIIYAGTGEVESFINSANSGLSLLFAGLTLKEVFHGMYNRYNELIDILVLEKQDYFVASLLRRNRDALMYLGKDEITIDHIC